MQQQQRSRPTTPRAQQRMLSRAISKMNAPRDKVQKLAHAGKFKGPDPDPLTAEKKETHITPTDSWRQKHLIRMAMSYAQRSDHPAAQVAAGLVISQVIKEQFDDKIGKAFLLRFWKWLMGQGEMRDVSRTPWGQQPLYDDPQVREYIDLFVTRKEEYKIKLQLLRHRVPMGINQSYLFFKYIVCGEEMGLDNYLDDWDRFEAAFNDSDQPPLEPSHPWWTKPYWPNKGLGATDAFDDDGDEPGGPSGRPPPGPPDKPPPRTPGNPWPVRLEGEDSTSESTAEATTAPTTPRTPRDDGGGGGGGDDGNDKGPPPPPDGPPPDQLTESDATGKAEERDEDEDEEAAEEEEEAPTALSNLVAKIGQLLDHLAKGKDEEKPDNTTNALIREYMEQQGALLGALDDRQRETKALQTQIAKLLENQTPPRARVRYLKSARMKGGRGGGQPRMGGGTVTFSPDGNDGPGGGGGTAWVPDTTTSVTDRPPQPATAVVEAHHDPNGPLSEFGTIDAHAGVPPDDIGQVNAAGRAQVHAFSGSHLRNAQELAEQHPDMLARYGGDIQALAATLARYNESLLASEQPSDTAAAARLESLRENPEEAAQAARAREALGDEGRDLDLTNPDDRRIALHEGHHRGLMATMEDFANTLRGRLQQAATRFFGPHVELDEDLGAALVQVANEAHARATFQGEGEVAYVDRVIAAFRGEMARLYTTPDVDVNALRQELREFRMVYDQRIGNLPEPITEPAPTQQVLDELNEHRAAAQRSNAEIAELGERLDEMQAREKKQRATIARLMERVDEAQAGMREWTPQVEEMQAAMRNQAQTLRDRIAEVRAAFGNEVARLVERELLRQMTVPAARAPPRESASRPTVKQNVLTARVVRRVSEEEARRREEFARRAEARQRRQRAPPPRELASPATVKQNVRKARRRQEKLASQAKARQQRQRERRQEEPVDATEEVEVEEEAKQRVRKAPSQAKAKAKAKQRRREDPVVEVEVEEEPERELNETVLDDPEEVEEEKQQRRPPQREEELDETELVSTVLDEPDEPKQQRRPPQQRVRKSPDERRAPKQHVRKARRQEEFAKRAEAKQQRLRERREEGGLDSTELVSTELVSTMLEESVDATEEVVVDVDEKRKRADDASQQQGKKAKEEAEVEEEEEEEEEEGEAAGGAPPPGGEGEKDDPSGEDDTGMESDAGPPPGPEPRDAEMTDAASKRERALLLRGLPAGAAISVAALNGVGAQATTDAFMRVENIEGRHVANIGRQAVREVFAAELQNRAEEWRASHEDRMRARMERAIPAHEEIARRAVEFNEDISEEELGAWIRWMYYGSRHRPDEEGDQQGGPRKTKGRKQ